VLVVPDSSSLITLAVCDCLGLLDELFESVRVPFAVHREVVVGGKAYAVELQGFLEGKVDEVDLRHLVIAAGGLGQGELEAMALYRAIHADLLLIDDRRARAVAKVNDIKTVGSLGVLLLAKQRGLIPEIRPLVKRIQNSPIHLGDRIIAEVLRLVDEE